MEDKIVFLGDSITEGFKQLDDYSNIINMGISGNRTLDVIERLEQVKEVNPKQLFLMIGINDIMTNHHIWFTDFPIDIERTYEFIVNYLKENLPETEVLLLSVLPIRADTIVSSDIEEQANKDIDNLNQYIKKLSDKDNFQYLNINDDFKESDGNRIRKELTYDGIHLSELGYKKFFKKVFNFLHNNRI